MRHSVPVDVYLSMCMWCVGPPSVEVFPGAEVTVDLNENLTLDCHASGRPEPTVTWTRSVSPVAIGATTIWDPWDASLPTL